MDPEKETKTEGGDAPQKTPEETIAELQGKVTSLEESNRKLEETNRMQTNNFKKLRDYTASEKEKLTATELALLQRQEEIDGKTEKLSEEQEKFKKEQHEEKKMGVIRSIAGNDTEFQKLLLDEYNIINVDDATEEGMKTRAAKALGIIQSTKPDMIRSAVNNRGTASPSRATGGYADTPAGKSLMQAMNLTTGDEKK